jgi:hypothetical protein
LKLLEYCCKYIQRSSLIDVIHVARVIYQLLKVFGGYNLLVYLLIVD